MNELKLRYFSIYFSKCNHNPITGTFVSKPMLILRQSGLLTVTSMLIIDIRILT